MLPGAFPAHKGLRHNQPILKLSTRKGNYIGQDFITEHPSNAMHSKLFQSLARLEVVSLGVNPLPHPIYQWLGCLSLQGYVAVAH